MVQHLFFSSPCSSDLRVPKIWIPVRLEWDEGKVVTETITECKEMNDDNDDWFNSLRSGGEMSTKSFPSLTVTKKTAPAISAGRLDEEGSDDEGDFKAKALTAHNECRAKHGVSPLKLDEELCKFAKEWATYLANRDLFEHRKNNNYGENLYCCWSSNPKAKCEGNKPVDSWYSEIAKYDYSRPGCNSSNTGHFTQVVWKESRKMGIAKAKSKSGKTIVVANYDPPGNFVGQYDKNVPKPL